MIYAGFWKRIAAGLIDFLLQLFFLVAIYGCILTIGGKPLIENLIANRRYYGIGFLVGAYVFMWLYNSLFLASAWQATPGLKAVGAKVVDYNNNRISFGRATLRYWVSSPFPGISDLLGVSVVFVYTGYSLAGYELLAFCAILITARKQAFFDLVAKTLVIKTQA